MYIDIEREAPHPSVPPSLYHPLKSRLLDDERVKRETTLGHLRDENDTIARVSEKPNAIFKEEMIARMVAAAVDIKKETLQRVGAERQFVESLEQYTKALQGGLTLVNHQHPNSGPLPPVDGQRPALGSA